MNKWIQLLIGFAISFFGLYFAFKSIDLISVIDSFKSLNYKYIILSILCLLSSVVVRCYRWRLLLISIKPIDFSSLLASTMIGYFANSVLPFKIGELLRGYHLSSIKNIKKSTVIGSIVLDRTCDMIGLIALFYIVSLFYTIDSNINITLIAMIGFSLLFILFFGFILFKRKFLIDKLLVISERRSKLLFQIILFLKSFGAGFSSLSSKNNLFKIFMYTIIIWALFILATYAIVLSFNLKISLLMVVVILLLTSLAIAVPAAPGSVGTHHFAAFYVMSNLLNFSDSISQSFAIVLHAVSYLPVVIPGAYYFFSSSTKIFDIAKKEMDEQKI